MSTTKRTDAPDLTEAAEALDGELERYAQLATAIERERLDSEKSLRRGAQLLGELQALETKLGERLQGLVAAITVARERQQEQAGAVERRADDLRRRSEVLTALLVRWQALGADAVEVTRLVQELQTKAEGDQPGNGAAREGFQQVDDSLGRLIAAAEALAETAGAERFPEFGRQAEGLRAQLLAARNRLRLLHDRAASTATA